jgi:KamA family protein
VKLVALRNPDREPDHPSARVERHAGQPIVLKPPEPIAPRRFKAYSEATLDHIPQLTLLSGEQRFTMRVVAKVLPFRVNDYVVDELIDWRRVPDDPLFQLTFPQRGMLGDEHFGKMASLLTRNAPKQEVKDLATAIRAELNPHPAGQQEHNGPMLDGRPLEGMQHKYPETVLFFPSQGQTCHSYCTFCFRWAQFVGDKELRFAASEASHLGAYLRAHPEVSDVLITGGDPMVMKTRSIATYVDELLDPELDSLRTIRFGSKALTFWPHRFVSDRDADDLLRLFDRIVAHGKHLAFMAHFNHANELDTDVCRRAIRRIRNTGAVIRAQAPLLRHINDSARAWAELWQTQVSLGVVPYYMFVERDTGARRYFEVPLARCQAIYRDALRRVSGLGRTARGPSMSAGPGKVEIQGVTELAGEKVFALRFLQARNPDWVQRPFFARYDEEATWLDGLRPAFGEDKFFFEDEYQARFGASILR